MDIVTATELHGLLDAADSQLARRKRWAILLTIVPAAFAIALIAVSRYQVHISAMRATEFERRAAAASAREIKLRGSLQALNTQIANAQAALDKTRRAAQNLGIVLFHQGNYGAAIRAYDSALQADPENVYLINLKGYAYFKLHDFSRATATQELAINKSPEFAHAYFDLARTQCANGDFTRARQTAETALEKFGAGMHSEMAADGEFIRLCKPILHELHLPAYPTE